MHGLRPAGGVPVLIVEGPHVAALDVGQQLVEHALHGVGQDLAFQAARRGAAEGGEQGGDRHIQGLEGVVHQFLHLLVAGGVHDERPGQRAHFHGLALPAPGT